MGTLLIVEDSRAQREILKVYMTPEPHTVLEAGTGKAALETIELGQVDLVLADMRMPELDGNALCRAVATMPMGRKPPIIILTADRDASTREQCLASGACEVLTKPISPEALLQAIARWMPRP